MQSEVLQALKTLSGYVWGLPLIVLLLGAGVYLTVLLRGLQFKMLWHALYLALVVRKEKDHKPGDVSHFQALMTALAATVGTGNIAGVAIAISTGGPGAMVWMWVTGLLGMATKYAEAVLAVKYRRRDEDGTWSGGPMYYIREGLDNRWLAAAFALFASIAAFGIGNMNQSNSVADVLNEYFAVPHLASGIFLALLTLAVTIGGIRSIARVTGFLVPGMVGLYMAGGLLIIFMHIDQVPAAFGAIFSSAFSDQAAVGGFAGATIKKIIQTGVARGLFSNESGLGSAPIAAATARTSHPVSQALVSMTQTFIDTLVVCTITGLVLIIGLDWQNASLQGASLTAASFSKSLGSEAGAYLVAISLAFFAYSTIIGWSFYGEKAFGYLSGGRAIVPYRFVFAFFVFLGAVVKLDLVWTVADIMNGFMAVPNLLALFLLAGVVRKETADYLAGLKK